MSRQCDPLGCSGFAIGKVLRLSLGKHGHELADCIDMLLVRDLVRSPGIVYQDDLVKVTAIENCHYHFEEGAPADVARDKSWAFRFQTADRVIVYSGDTGKCANMVDFAKDASSARGLSIWQSTLGPA